MKAKESKYSEKSGFKTPENYFESFEDRLLNRLKEENSSILSTKQKVFKVPESYFENLEDRIIAKTETQTPVISIFRRKHFYYAAAVAAIFILMLGNFFKNENNQSIGWDDIEVSAMENYIDEGYETGYIELSSTEVSDFIFDDGRLIDDSDFTMVNSDAVFEYIEENIEDPTYILE